MAVETVDNEKQWAELREYVNLRSAAEKYWLDHPSMQILWVRISLSEASCRDLTKEQFEQVFTPCNSDPRD